MFKDLPSGETHCNLVADAKKRAFDLYKAPFRYLSSTNLIRDDDNKVAVSLFFNRLDGELIAEALNEYYANHKEK